MPYSSKETSDLNIFKSIKKPIKSNKTAFTKALILPIKRGP